MPDPEIVQVQRQFHDALLLREQGQMAQMAARYAQIERGLTDKMELLAREMAEKKAAGEVITEGSLYRMERYRALHAQALLELERYAKGYAEPLIEKEQRYYGEIGIRSAQLALLGQLRAGGIDIAWNRLPIEAIENMIGMAGDGSPLARLLAKSYPAAMDGMIQQLITSTAQGINPRETARRMADGFGAGLDRMLTVARSEQLRVFRTANQQQLRESGIVSGYKRISAHDDRVCPGCLAEDGKEYDTKVDFESHPNCRCSLIPQLTVGPQAQWTAGGDWFAEQSEDTQRKILGPGRYDLWASGGVSDFTQFAKHTTNETWGGAVVPRTLAELTG